MAQTIHNTKSNGRALARGMIADGSGAEELHHAEMLLGMYATNGTKHPRPHMVAGFLDIAHRAACWNGLCVLMRHADSHHVDVTGYSWDQARGTTYCAECGGYTACDHASIVTTIY